MKQNRLAKVSSEFLTFFYRVTKLKDFGDSQEYLKQYERECFFLLYYFEGDFRLSPKRVNFATKIF